ncbi:MAG: aminotransferase class IV, partial [Patescibacteria group bacterium]
EDVVFHLDDHLERLRHSAQELEIAQPTAIQSSNAPALKSQLKQLLRLNKFGASLVWFYVLAGLTSDGFTPIGEPVLLVRVSKFDEAALCSKQGIAVKTVNAVRQMPEIKCVADYALAEVMLARFAPQGFDEILYSSHGAFFELSRKNFFLVLPNGTILTPNKDILQGITRRIVIDLARGLKIPVVLREIVSRDIARAKEAFATSTACGIAPLNRIDDRVLKPGKITKKLQKAFLGSREKYFTEVGDP